MLHISLLGIYNLLDDLLLSYLKNLLLTEFREILEEMYDEVASGNEIRSVVMAGRRHKEFPMGKIG